MEERWVPVIGWEDLYEVSSFGQARRIGGRLRKVYYHPASKYGMLTLCRDGCLKNHMFHRLLFASFNGPIAPGLEINHQDDDAKNNRLDNLEAVTPKQNKAHHWQMFWARKLGITCGPRSALETSA